MNEEEKCSNCHGKGFVVDDGYTAQYGIKDYGEHECEVCNGTGNREE